jgi:hypothetical protein
MAHGVTLPGDPSSPNATPLGLDRWGATIGLRGAQKRSINCPSRLQVHIQTDDFCPANRSRHDLGGVADAGQRLRFAGALVAHDMESSRRLNGKRRSQINALVQASVRMTPNRIVGTPWHTPRQLAKAAHHGSGPAWSDAIMCRRRHGWF